MDNQTIAFIGAISGLIALAMLIMAAHHARSAMKIAHQCKIKDDAACRTCPLREICKRHAK